MRRADWLGWVSLHTTLRPKRGGYGRKDGDEDVEDFSPGGVVVESSHSVKGCFCGLDISVLRLILQTRYRCVRFLMQRYDIFLALCDLLRLTATYCDLAGRKMLIVR